MQEAAQVILSGFGTGAAYVIMAIGLSLVYGVSQVFNYAYGSLLMLAAYFAWVFSTTILAGLPFGLSYAIVLPIMFGLGMAIESGIVRPLRRQANWGITSFIATLGLGLLINSLIQQVFGPRGKFIPPLSEGIVKFGGFAISEHRLIMLAIAIAIIIALVIFLRKTRLGLSMRAVSEDMTGANMVGIPINRVFNLTFGLSTALGAISGLLLGSIYMLAPEGGWNLFIKAFVIIVLGGAGSLPGAAVAAFILGILEAIIGWQLGSLWVLPFWLVALIAILVVRPRGIFGIR